MQYTEDTKEATASMQAEVLQEKAEGGKGIKVKGLRWFIISLIGLATVINYIDRNALNIMWPYIYKDFGIADVNSKEALAYITMFFTVAYALGQTLSGKLMDAIGTRLGFAISIVVWSVSIGLHSIAKTLSTFSIFRFTLGLGEAGNWPGAAKSNAEWFPVKERAIAQGIFNAGASMGSIISAPLIAGLYIAFGWKATFFGIAILGFLWIIPWLLINKNTPDKHPWITDKEKEHITQDQVAVSSSAKAYSWKELMKFKATWAIILSRLFIDPIWWLFVTWLPTFLKEEYTFDIKQIGAFAWMPYVGAAIGSLLGGYFSSYLIRKGKNAVAARKIAISIGCAIMLAALVAIAIVLPSLKEQPGVAIALITVVLFGFQILIGNLQTLPSDFFNGKNVGTVAGMGGTAAMIGVVATTWLVPVITKTSYVGFFALGAIMVPMAWIAIVTLTKKK